MVKLFVSPVAEMPEKVQQVGKLQMLSPLQCYVLQPIHRTHELVHTLGPVGIHDLEDGLIGIAALIVKATNELSNDRREWNATVGVIYSFADNLMKADKLGGASNLFLLRHINLRLRGTWQSYAPSARIWCRCFGP